MREERQYPRTTAVALNIEQLVLTACTAGAAAAESMEESWPGKGSAELGRSWVSREIKPRKLKKLYLYDLLRSTHTKNADVEKNCQIVKKTSETHSMLANAPPALVNSQEEPSPTG